MKGVAQTVLQRFTKAESVDGARAVSVDLGRRRFPAGEAAFTEALDDLAQPRQDLIALEVTGTGTLVEPSAGVHMV